MVRFLRQNGISFIIAFGMIAYVVFVFQDYCFRDYDELPAVIAPYTFFHEENGKYIPHFFARLFGMWLPNLFGINPQDFINPWGNIARGVILVLYSFAMTFFMPKNYLRPAVLVFAFIVLITCCYYVMGDNFLGMYSALYGYILTYAFFLGFWAVFAHHFLNGKIPDRKYLYFNCALALCAGNSTQTANFTTMVALCLIFGVFLLTQLMRENFRTVIDKLLSKEVLINIGAPIGCLLLGFIIMVACPGFWHEVSWRHADSFETVVNIFPDFCKVYWQIVIKQNLPFFGTIFALSVLVAVFKKTVKPVLLGWALIFGMMLYYFLLVLAGPTFPVESLRYWLHEPFYKYSLLTIFAAVIVMLLGCLAAGDDKNVFVKILKTVLGTGVLFLILYNFLWVNTFEFFRAADIRDLLKNGKQEIYTCDKLSLFYAEGGGVLPQYCNDAGTVYAWYEKYYKKIYNADVSREGILYRDDALEIFAKNGGEFQEGELENIKFGRLTNFRK